MTQQTDIIIIGAGPAGLAISKSLANTALNIALIEKNSHATLSAPPTDGREIALTHVSKNILTKLGVWDAIDKDDKYFLRQAQVSNGDSPYTLHFATPKTALGKPTDTLGYLLSNHQIRRALYAQCQTHNNLHFITAMTVSQVTTHHSGATVLLENGKEIQAKLVIAADSRFSKTRQQMDIPTTQYDFHRTVIVFRMSHTLSNNNTASEYFHYGRTLAVLPITKYLSSMVITIDSDKADSIWQLDADATRHDIITQLNGRLGDMTLVGDKHRYPLIGIHAKRFYAKRCALIGDAAVGMHPVTAHGFNLGLQGQDILAKHIRAAHRQGHDIGSIDLLKAYSREHMAQTLPLYHATNFIVKLFTTETPPAKILRHAALRAGNLLIPFKKMVSKQLTG